MAGCSDRKALVRHSERVEFYRHHLSTAELEAVAQVFGSTFLTTGPKSRAFEAALADYLQVPHVVAVSSCSAALLLALAALDIGDGDEVITTPMTFAATANAVLLRGAQAVFADVDARTGNLDPQKVRQALSAKTRAILVVHLYGQMCDMVSLRQIADQAGVALIEDAAHCIEGRASGVGPGQLGDIACFSFYATKNLTCGEGGAVATRHEELARRIEILRLHGLDRSAADRYSEPTYRHWDMTELGYKANLPDILAAVLLAQMPGIDARLQSRQAIARRYEEAFSEMPGVDFPRLLAGHTSARHLFTIWVEAAKRDGLLRDLGREGIGVAVNYRAVHRLSYYRERLRMPAGSLPVAESIGDRTLSIPMYPLLRDDEVTRVIDTVSRLVSDDAA